MVWVSSMFFLIATWLDHKVCTCWTFSFYIYGPFDLRFHLNEWIVDPTHVHIGCTWAHLFVTCHSSHANRCMNPFFLGKIFLKECSLNLLIGFPLCLRECGSWALLVNVVSSLIYFLSLLYIFVILRDSLCCLSKYIKNKWFGIHIESAVFWLSNEHLIRKTSIF